MELFEGYIDEMNRRINAVAQTHTIDNAELGQITSDFSLKADRFETAIPKGDYMIARNLLPAEPIKVTSSEADDHSHNVEIPPEKVKKVLSPGDRVLVVWCGTEPIVIDVIVSSNQLS